MKSSIRSLARFLVRAGGRRARRRRTPAWASMVSRLSAPCWWRSAFMRLRHPDPACGAAPPARAPPPPAPAAAPLPSSQAATRIVGQLGPIATARGRPPKPSPTPSAPTEHLDDDGQALLPVAERRQVGGEPLRQHGEDLGGRVDRGRVGPRVGVDRRARVTRASTSATATRILTAPPARGAATVELVEVAGVVVVDGGPGQGAQIADRGIRLRGAPGDGGRLRSAAGEKSASKPRWVITCRAMR